MAKRVIDFSSYEEPTWEEYTGDDPLPNKWFNAKATRIKYLEEDDQLQVIFEVSDGDFKGWGRGWYAPLDPENSQYWKTQALFKALQGGATKNVTIDPENEKSLEAFLAKAKPVKIKTREYNDKITLGRLAPMLEAVPAAKATGAKAALEPEPVPDDEVEGDYTEEELGELSVEDLEEIISEEFEADLPKKLRNAAAYKKKLVETILELQNEDTDEDEDDDEADEADEEFEDGFDEDDEEEEDEPEPEPAPKARRSRATKAAPAKAAPAKATTTTRRRRG